jgi:tRNA threonylcarbamoyladenosine modification (KEOPS) complex  Pcc1 subunit
MKVSCNLTIEYSSTKKAEKILRSIKVDDYDFVESRLNGNRLETVIESNSIPSLIHTLDDYLACISVAEKIVDKN